MPVHTSACSEHFCAYRAGAHFSKVGPCVLTLILQIWPRSLYLQNKTAIIKTWWTKSIGMTWQECVPGDRCLWTLGLEKHILQICQLFWYSVLFLFYFSKHLGNNMVCLFLYAWYGLERYFLNTFERLLKISEMAQENVALSYVNTWKRYVVSGPKVQNTKMFSMRCLCDLAGIQSKSGIKAISGSVEELLRHLLILLFQCIDN